MRGVLGVNFYKIPPMEAEIAVKVFSSTSKVPFIIGRLQFNTSSLQAMHVECFVEFQKILSK